MKLAILGTRGVPAAHGGFETFAEQLAVFLVGKGWEVTVYCQESRGDSIYHDVWKGIRRVHIPVAAEGSLGSVRFDALAVREASRERIPCLVLGYNTAIFCLWLRLCGVRQIINMDGIEWKRKKWGAIAKLWFYLNEIAGAKIGNHLVADHPHIAEHLGRHTNRRKITMIPYGAAEIFSADPSALTKFGIVAGGYCVVIARVEPENSLLEIVRAFSSRCRKHKLVVLGKFEDQSTYHNAVLSAASDQVVFPGAIYEQDVVNALRSYAALYVHGHQVGGTNPSLVEAMGAGCAVVAHDNKFNRWVAGTGAEYFSGVEDLSNIFDNLLGNEPRLLELQQNSLQRFRVSFTWANILHQYEELLIRESQ